MDEYTFKHCPKGHYYQGGECPYCKAQTAKEFKLCSKGHYYQDDECPYCKTPMRPFDDLAEKNSIRYMKVCPNDHAYGSEETCCPYCGEPEVCGHHDMTTAILCSITLSFNYKTTLQIDDNQECEVASLEVTFLDHGPRTSYYIRYDDGTATPDLDYKTAPDFDYKSNIRIGGTTFTGKEFVKWVDFMPSVKEFENH